MPAEGSEQQRLATELQTKLEIRSIERELNKLDDLRKANQVDYIAGNEDIQDQLKKTFNDIEKNLDLQKILAEEILAQTKKIEEAKGDIAKADAEVIFDAMVRQAAKTKAQGEDLNKTLRGIRSRISLEQKIADEQRKQLESAQGFLGKFGTIFNQQQRYYNLLRDTKIVSNKNLLVWSSIGAILSEISTMFLKVDEGLAKFRIYMGMLRPDMERLRTDMLDVATSMTRVGVNIEGVTAATIALGAELGGVHAVSKDLIETTALMKAQLGVAEETSAGFLRNLAAIGKTTAQAQRQMTYMADVLTSAAGVPLNLVMQDVAKMSGNALAIVSKMPMQIIRTAVEARKLGITINKMAESGASLLNFTESVQSEMEAAVLLGENMNVQLSRELAYRGKIAEATQHMLSEARRLNFEAMDFFQKRAFAAAYGFALEDLNKMIVATRQLEEARNNEALGLQAEVALIDKMRSANAATLKDSSLQRELAVKQMANQERIVALTQQWNQLMMEATRVLYPLFDIALSIAIVLVKIGPAVSSIYKILSKISVISTAIASAWKKVAFAVGLASHTATKFSGVGIKFLAFIGKLAWVGKIFSALSFAAPLLKAIPVIGWIITSFQLIYNFSKRIGKAWELLKQGKIGEAIVEGLKAVVGALYDTLIQPFVDAFKWIMKWFGGHSPSYIGLSIVKGITSVGARLFDALSWPWRKFLAWVVDKVPFMGGIAKKIRGGITGAMEDMGAIENKSTIKTEAIPTISSEKAAEAATTTVVQQQQEQNTMALAEILKAINTLNANLMSGKIGIYLDGQLLSATLARNTSFRGGYGVNNMITG